MATAIDPNNLIKSYGSRYSTFKLFIFVGIEYDWTPFRKEVIDKLESL